MNYEIRNRPRCTRIQSTQYLKSPTIRRRRFIRSSYTMGRQLGRGHHPIWIHLDLHFLGEFGSVYECEYKRSGQLFAVKYINKDVLSAFDLDLLNNEIEIIRKLTTRTSLYWWTSLKPGQCVLYRDGTRHRWRYLAVH